MFISWMLTRPSFKKSLIEEQFQGNYLKLTTDLAAPQRPPQQGRKQMTSSPNHGLVPFDQKFRKFRFKIKWNRKFPETHFENFGQPLEVVLFSGNLEITEIYRSIWHFYRYNSNRAWKLQDGGAGVDTTLHAKRSVTFNRAFYWLPILLLSAFLKNCGLVVPNFPWHLPGLHNLTQEKFASLLSQANNSWVSQVNIPEEFT